jgi:predicted ATPase
VKGRDVAIGRLLRNLVRFRSPEHRSWFVTSASVLGGTLALAGVLRALGLGPPFRGLFVWGAVGHGCTMFAAIANAIRRVENERVMSRDCIWFNAAMAGVYPGLHAWLGGEEGAGDGKETGDA